VLEQLVNSVARDVEDPETKMSVWKRSQALGDRERVARTSGTRRARAATCACPRSDRGRTTRRFLLQHTGVPSLDLRFGGFDNNDGVYHSIYDDY